MKRRRRACGTGSAFEPNQLAADRQQELTRRRADIEVLMEPAAHEHGQSRERLWPVRCDGGDEDQALSLSAAINYFSVTAQPRLPEEADTATGRPAL